MSTKHTINYLTNFFPLEYGKDNATLRLVCEPLTFEEIHTQPVELLCEALRELMWEYDGVGLAAPQIGQNKRIISVTSWKGGKRGNKFEQQTIMINPTITKKSEKMFVSEEGCLSLPNVLGNVKRHQKITVHYWDENGRVQEQKLRGFNAAIVQHEIDHLDGVLFIDKLTDDKV